VLELDEGLGESFLGPAFGVGLGGVEEEAVVGGEDIGEQSGEFGFGDELGGFGD